MRIETVLVIGLLLLIFGLIFGTVYFLPILHTKLRALTYGLSLTFGQARVITKDHCNRKEFLMHLKDIMFWTDIPLEKLTFHYLAGGNMKNLKDGIVQMKQKNRDIDFTILSTFDLAGRDLKREIEKAELNNWTFSWDD